MVKRRRLWTSRSTERRARLERIAGVDPIGAPVGLKCAKWTFLWRAQQSCIEDMSRARSSLRSSTAQIKKLASELTHLQVPSLQTPPSSS